MSTELDDIDTRWDWERQLEERRLEEQLRLLRPARPCSRWWCFKTEPHTHDDPDPDLQNKQALERRLSLHREWESAADIEHKRTDR